MCLKIIDAVKKGMVAARMSLETDVLTEGRIRTIINEFDRSEKKSWMLKGQQYYEVDNDILKSRINAEDYKSDNRIAHAKYKEQVDEKVAYLLSKEMSYTCGNEDYLEKVKEILKSSNYFDEQYDVGYESSNKGIGWMMVYIDPEGKLKVKVIPSEQCIPVWQDSSHTELDYMIRRYNACVWRGDSRHIATNIEVWSPTDVKYYRLENRVLVVDTVRSTDENGFNINHYEQNGQQSWGKVPFIPFKNNHCEMNDLKPIKGLVDEYDKSRSQSANYIDDLVNYIIKVYGYSTKEENKFLSQIKKHIIMIEGDKEDGDAEIITPQTSVSNFKEHADQVKRDLIEDGRSVNKDLDKFGSAPSGIALKFMYSGLELKANAMAREFKKSFRRLLYFINHYMSITNTSFKEDEISIEFNVDMKTDETEVIQNCSSSKGLISDETIIANHPWAKEDEYDKVKKQLQQNNPFKDKVPIGDGDEE